MSAFGCGMLLLIIPLSFVAHWAFCAVDPRTPRLFAWPVLGIVTLVPFGVAMPFKPRGSEGSGS
jgi:hypothetical protein